MATAQTQYRVYMNDELVLEISEGGGPLISRCAPPPLPGEEPVMHPFLSATAFVPKHEGELRSLLDQAHSLAEYLSRLRESGYRVVELPGKVSG
jgi:hypothetical protein